MSPVVDLGEIPTCFDKNGELVRFYQPLKLWIINHVNTLDINNDGISISFALLVGLNREIDPIRIEIIRDLWVEHLGHHMALME